MQKIFFKVQRLQRFSNIFKSLSWNMYDIVVTEIQEFQLTDGIKRSSRDS